VEPGVVHQVGVVVPHDVKGRAIAALVGSDPSPQLRVSGSGVVLATGDGFVSSPQDRDALARLAHLVDMEGHAVAAAAQRLGVAMRLAEAVSDDAGHGAAESWSEALAGASALLGQWLDRVVHVAGPAPGQPRGAGEGAGHPAGDPPGGPPDPGGVA
jgi:adenosylhomocysteine nucleosidase